MKVTIELNEEEIREIITNHINNEYGLDIKPDELPIETKSKQNYRSEWEHTAIRIQVEIQR